MNVFKVLDKATPLEKAKAFSLMTRPQIRKNSVTNDYVKKVEEAIEDYNLKQYESDMLDELKSFKGNFKNWQDKIKPVTGDYESKLVKEYILKEMDKYNNLSQVNSKDLIQWAETLAAYLVGRGLQTNQIRKFLDSIRKVEVEVKKDIPVNFESDKVMFLKVHLAYATARQTEVKPLMLMINTALNKIREGEEGFNDFTQLVNFVEAIVAYHKYYGGSD